MRINMLSKKEYIINWMALIYCIIQTTLLILGQFWPKIKFMDSPLWWNMYAHREKTIIEKIIDIF